MSFILKKYLIFSLDDFNYMQKSHYLNNEENTLTLENAAYKIEDFFFSQLCKILLYGSIKGAVN